MGADAFDALLEHAAELATRDEDVAARLESARDLADRAGAVRARAAEVEAALARLPDELDDLERRRIEAAASESSARRELATAMARLAGLEASRRPRGDELDRARSELETVRELEADAAAEVERGGASQDRLREEQASLETEAAALVATAATIARDLHGVEGIAQAALRAPGASIADLDEWGAQVRSALFVVRGTLETHRERIVAEANALGSAVLGEQLGASSVAVVRRRIEESRS